MHSCHLSVCEWEYHLEILQWGAEQLEVRVGMSLALAQSTRLSMQVPLPPLEGMSTQIQVLHSFVT